MANQIHNVIGTPTALTITLNSLTDTSGRQSTVVTTATEDAAELIITVSVTCNASSAPTANTACEVYAIRGDGTYRDDNAGTSDAAFTRIGAPLLGLLEVGPSPSTSQILERAFRLPNPGKEWGIAVVNNTGQTLHSSGNAAQYTTIIPEIQ